MEYFRHILMGHELLGIYFKDTLMGHSADRYKGNSCKNKKKCLMHFEPDTMVFILSN